MEGPPNLKLSEVTFFEIEIITTYHKVAFINNSLFLRTVIRTVINCEVVTTISHTHKNSEMFSSLTQETSYTRAVLHPPYPNPGSPWQPLTYIVS